MQLRTCSSPGAVCLTGCCEAGGRSQALRAAFTQLMTAPQAEVAAAVAGLVARLQSQLDSAATPLAPRDELALRLDRQYPGGDVGVLASFFLNFVSRP